MTEWMMHLYSALLCIVVHPKRFTTMCVCVCVCVGGGGGGGGLSSTTTSTWMMRRLPQDNGSYRWKGEIDSANQVDDD